jgi:hypothetical protein
MAGRLPRKGPRLSHRRHAAGTGPKAGVCHGLEILSWTGLDLRKSRSVQILLLVTEGLLTLLYSLRKGARGLRRGSRVRSVQIRRLVHVAHALGFDLYSVFAVIVSP